MSFGFGFALPAYPLRGGGGNNPFNQSGPTLDLSFTGNAGNLSGADTYTLNTNFITPEYQVAAQYAIWESGVGMVPKTFADIITFTRASTGTYFNSAGTLTTAAINEARFDYDPATLLTRGFLIEEARTNSIRNNTMQGAVAGTPGTLPSSGWSIFTSLTGLTSSVVGTGVESGITYIDFRLNGTPSGAGAYFINFETTTQVVAASGQTWTSSAYYKLQAGSLAGITAVSNAVSARSAGGADLSSVATPFTLTTAALNTQRAVSTITSNPATTAFETQFVRLDLSGAAIDITLRIGLPQLEQGAFATSVIPTTTTALTRNADVASVNALSPWFNSVAGTLYAESLRTTTAAASTFPAYAEFDNGTTNRYGVYSTQTASTNEYRSFVIDSGVAQADIGGVASRVAAGTIVKQAGAFTANDFALSVNGSSVFTDLAGALPSSVNRMSIGSSYIAANFANAWLRRITYYPRRLSNADLQTITA